MKTYTIPKFCHYSNFFPKFYCLNKPQIKLTWKVKFTESCKYEINEKSCVNKLFGFCFGLGVHKNSLRFGWTYNKETNNIFIWHYDYSKGRLMKLKLYSCDINEEHEYKVILRKQNNDYIGGLVIDGNEESAMRFENITSKFITTLGPYFGGETRAPHKIIIEKTN